MVTFIGYFYFMQILCHYDSVYLLIIAHYTTVIMLEAHSKWDDLYFQVTGDMWLTFG